MALTSNNLSNPSGFGAGKTQNFLIQYDDTLPDPNGVSPAANVITNADALIGVVENELNVTTGWFGTPAGKFGTGHRQVVNLNLADTAGSGGSINEPGANNSGYGSAINLDAQNLFSDTTVGSARVQNVFMAEWSEILMSVAGNWNAGDSSGEGLSQYCSIQRFQTGHYDYYGSWVQSWLNGVASSPNAARSDWVTQTFTGSGSIHGDGDSVSFGCALAFLFYLKTQLGFTENQIIPAYNANLASIYNALTGDPSNPFPQFLSLIETVYPANQTAAIPGPVTDNPFPIAVVSFWNEKTTFGHDEAKDIINSHGGLVSEAFYVVVEGLSKNSFQSLGIQVSPFTGTFFQLPGVTIQPNPLGAEFQAGVGPAAPQRIRIPFDIILGSAVLSHFPGTGSASYGLSVALNIGGTQVAGSPASTLFELLAGADPYFTNVGQDQNLAYLSQDLRVFSVTPLLDPAPISGVQPMTDSVGGAFTYIQNLLTRLNGSFSNPNGPDPFTTIIPNQSGVGQADSSVTPVTPIGPFIFGNNYNFAIARVRLQGSSGVSGEAKDVRVFFRMWNTQSNDTDYDPNGTYSFTPDAAGKPGSPSVGAGNTTFPFFATGNLSGNTDYGPGGPNIRTLVIPDHQDSLWAYYGCFLNVYDPTNLISGAPLQSYLAGTHHCLVAQIAFDDAPIPNGASPLSWDQMAQRNLQVTLSDNPGPAATHRIPQTFDCRPSRKVAAAVGRLDELMIDWGAIPPGSVASLYWPQVLAADVIDLAARFYGAVPIMASDAHTIQISVTSGISYIPIPAGTGQNFAGLFTVELPPTISAGQEFNITVRRVTSRAGPPPPPPPPPLQSPQPQSPQLQSPQLQSPRRNRARTRTLPSRTGGEAVAEAIVPDAVVEAERLIFWRSVVGTFQVQIPVTTGDKILPSEDTTLAIMKWRFGQMSPSNRWYPVLQRYIAYISGRIDGLGGNAAGIPPSLTGIPPGGKPAQEEDEFTGKVCEVIFDCDGEFEGFVVADCCESRCFKSRSRHMGELVLKVCREQLRLSVFYRPGCEDIPVRLVVRR